RGILRSAIVLGEREDHRATLPVALGVAEAAAQLLQVAGDLVEIGTHLLDLVVDRAALRRLSAEQREEAGGIAAHAARLLGDAVELGLLALGRRLVAPDLFGAGRFTAVAVDHRELGFEPLAHRIAAL